MSIPRVALIGCGRIGSLWDEADTEGPARTHASAWQRSGRAQLIALCDQDPTRLREAGRWRGIDARYLDYRAMLERERPDLISLCTPPEVRLAPIEAALAAGVRWILCEKPLATDLATAHRIAQRVREAGAVMAVAHLRRWAPGIREAVDLIHAGELGAPQWAVGHYDKGILNNGSHLLDLLARLLGLPRRVTTLGRDRAPGPHGDPTPDLLLEYAGQAGEDFPVYLVGSDFRRFSLFELDILGTRGRLTLTDKGNQIRLHGLMDDPRYPGYRNLVETRVLPARLGDSLELAVAELLDMHAGRVQSSACGLDQALEVMGLVETCRLAHQRGIPLDLAEVIP